MIGWLGSSLSRKLLLALAAVLAISSLLFLILFVSSYRAQLERARAEVSTQLNRLLQVSLENAMLKHDLDGLREIVAGLGRQDGVDSVMIVNPAGEVRFASSPQLLGRRLARDRDAGCAVCHQAEDGNMPGTRFLTNERGVEVLRSANPVRNQARCVTCHGEITANPVNGVLFVDYDAADIRSEAADSALLLSGSGALVVLLTLLGAGLFLRRAVLRPVDELTSASRALSAGALDARVEVRGVDELGELGQTFNDMAGRLQQSLRELGDKEDYLQRLIDAVPDGIRVIDQDFTVLKANQAFCAQLGLGADEVVGQPCYSVSHQRDSPCPPTYVTCPLHEISNERRALTCTHHHLRKDGTPLHVEVSAAPLEIRDDAGVRTVVVEAVRDLDQEVRLSHEQRLSEIGQLATGVAHEIHNPLASVRLGLQALRRGVESDGANGTEWKEYLRIVDSEIDDCIDVTSRLLRLSMPPGERPQLVSLRRAVGDVTSLLAYEAEKAGVEVALDFEAEDFRVMASESEIRMVVLNLVQNAFHAMAEGGHLVLRCRAEGDRVVLGVTDDGSGIRPEHLPRIFDPFFSRRADGIDGTGLGLAISKAIVDRHNGQISVESTPGVGTCFTIRLPNADEVL